MMMTLRAFTRHGSLTGAGLASIVLAVGASNAHAQTTTPIDWEHGTTLSAFVGAASASSDTDAAAGLSLGWEITPGFGVEGRGIWLRAGVDQEAFSATMAGRFALRRGRPFVPFAALGAGLYYASFDSQATDIPDFYRQRMPSTGLEGSFTDFALSFGGGAELFVSRHLAVRPEVSVLLAVTTSDARAVTVYGAQLVYHFEEHIITARRTR